MKLRTLLFVLSLGISSLSAQDVFTTFTVPGGSSNTGSFTLDEYGLNDLADLSISGSTETYNYAWQYFTPTITGSYSLGVQSASYDPVLILYQGVSSFPLNPASGAIALNDDGLQSNFHGLTISSGFNPIIENISLTAGTTYVVSITSFSPGRTIPLPSSFFVYGPSQVSVAGSPAVPEPSTYAALAGLAALGFAVLRRQRRRLG